MALTEAEWQEQVIDLAHALGWEHNFTRRTIGKGGRWVTATSKKGWPDLTLWSARHQRLIFVELKTDLGAVKPEQTDCHVSLRAAGLECYVWRPRDFDTVHAVLAGGYPETGAKSPV